MPLFRMAVEILNNYVSRLLHGYAVISTDMIRVAVEYAINKPVSETPCHRVLRPRRGALLIEFVA
jgi:hypothetical protein